MTEKELNILINRYFEGETTIAEERLLRRELAQPSVSGRLADEARAVMGYSLCCQEPRKEVRKTIALARTWRSAAAAITVAAITATAILTYPESPDPGECVAYLNGHEISHQQTVMTMMIQDLNEIGDASDRITSDMTDDINEIADIFNSTEM